MRGVNLITVLILLVLVSSLAKANLVTNGDFELGNVGFATGYLYHPTSIIPAGTYAIDTNPSNVHHRFASYSDHTSGTGNMMIVNGHETSNVTLWQESVSVFSNTEYVFSFWLSTCFSYTHLAEIEYFINGISIGSMVAPEEPGVWVQGSQVWHSGNNMVATIRLVDINTEGGGNDFAIDDISFVPEPATLLLLGLGGLMVRKRRQV
ncbi:MAG: PEP-CTERM sorting domain-containing protein [Planctomycetota bacterium]